MAQSRELSKPPIREALIDFRIAADSVLDASRFNSLRTTLADVYPIVEERRPFRAELRVESGKLVPPLAEDLGFGGLIFSNREKTRLAQFRHDGFTFNCLQPYPGATVLIEEALRLWELFRELQKPVEVTRIAMRYINGLELPYEDGDDFSRFLAAAPEMPDGTPQHLSNFLSRVVAHEPPNVVTVTQKLDYVPGKKPVPVILDVDAFCEEPLHPDRDTLHATLGELRSLKNRVFFAFLTDEAVGLYQ